MTDTAPTDFRQHVELETPEHVLLDLEVAGVGSRVLAALVDWIIVGALGAMAIVGFSSIAPSARWVMAVGVGLAFAIAYGYFTLFEALRDGQTPGKRQLEIRVIRDSGHGVTLAESAARNLLLPIDLMGLIGVILIAVSRKGQRLGDLVAGTLVVRDRPVPVATGDAATTQVLEAAGQIVAGTPVLSDSEYRLLREFFQRAPDLPAPVVERLAGEIAERLRAGLGPVRGDTVLAALRSLHAAEGVRRRGRFGARGAGATAVAERLVSHKAPRWDEFQSLADRVAHGGLDALRADQLPEFAARYREVAADLARARTYKADPMVLLRLERMVAAGHNALYRSERRTCRRMATFLALEAPAAVVHHRRVVALAFIAFMLPALAGFALIRERPELAPQLLPDVMLGAGGGWCCADRGGAGVFRRRRG